MLRRHTCLFAPAAAWLLLVGIDAGCSAPPAVLDSGMAVDSGTDAPVNDARGAADAGGSDAALPRVVSISAGSRHTCALVSSGTVRCWGQNPYGELGYGHTSTIGDDETVASAGDVRVGGAVEQVVAGGHHTCASLAGGVVRCWGAGSSGQLGYGDVETIGDDEDPETAGDVDVGGVVTQVVVGGGHTCALLEGGTVRCWGDGYWGQLGYGNCVPASFGDPLGDPACNIGDDETPASAGDVSVGGTVVRLAAGNAHTCALLETGAVRCWGMGRRGVLGRGDCIPIPKGPESQCNLGDDETPASVGDIDIGAEVIAIAAGGDHTCVLTAGGTVRCWGDGCGGALGYGDAFGNDGLGCPNTIGDDETPAAAGDVDVGELAVGLAAGIFHTCAILPAGKLRCWGSASRGQLGYGNTVDVGDDEVPADVGDVDVGEGVTAVTGGFQHTCALLETGAVRCWGRGDLGALGYGNQNDIGDDEPPASSGEVPIF